MVISEICQLLIPRQTDKIVPRHEFCSALSMCMTSYKHNISEAHCDEVGAYGLVGHRLASAPQNYCLSATLTTALLPGTYGGTHGLFLQIKAAFLGAQSFAH